MKSTLPSVLRQSEAAETVMARHATTFSWANRLMPREFARDFAVLYAFCRLADDVVDEVQDPEEAREAVAILSEGLLAGSSEVPALDEFLELSRRRRIPLEIPQQLLIGVASDIGRVRIEDRAELIRYAYRVASTVGLMVCHIVDLRDARAHAHAIDLGIGMQLTNICRDVVEDALNDRVYLPAERIDPERVLLAVHQADVAARQEVYARILEMLSWADAYYRSGHAGVGYLPIWARLGVVTAGRCYAAIGGVIRRRGPRYWEGRCFTRKPEKLLRTLGSILELVVRPGCWSPRFAAAHQLSLHAALKGLPCAQATT